MWSSWRKPDRSRRAAGNVVGRFRAGRQPQCEVGIIQPLRRSVGNAFERRRSLGAPQHRRQPLRDLLAGPTALRRPTRSRRAIVTARGSGRRRRATAKIDHPGRRFGIERHRPVGVSAVGLTILSNSAARRSACPASAAAIFASSNTNSASGSCSSAAACKDAVKPRKRPVSVAADDERPGRAE